MLVFSYPSAVVISKTDNQLPGEVHVRYWLVGLGIVSTFKGIMNSDRMRFNFLQILKHNVAGFRRLFVYPIDHGFE